MAGDTGLVSALVEGSPVYLADVHMRNLMSRYVRVRGKRLAGVVSGCAGTVWQEADTSVILQLWLVHQIIPW